MLKLIYLTIQKKIIKKTKKKKIDSKDATGIDISKLAAKSDLAS